MEEDRLLLILRALGDPRRLAIFRLLREGTYCNCELGEALELSPNLISHHLRVLREVGLVDTERHPTDGRWVLYSLNREALAEVEELVSAQFDPQGLGTRMPPSCLVEGLPCACHA